MSALGSAILSINHIKTREKPASHHVIISGLPSFVISRVIDTFSLFLGATTARVLIITLPVVSHISSGGQYCSKHVTLRSHLNFALSTTLACVGGVLPNCLAAALVKVTHDGEDDAVCSDSCRRVHNSMFRMRFGWFGNERDKQ